MSERNASLIEDLTELEALEDAADLKAARDALGESKKPIRWEEVKAEEFLAELRDANLYWRLCAAIDGLAQNARPSGCVKLAGEPDLYRVRVGDYRIVYQVNDVRLTLLVLSIGHRRAVYRR